MELLRISNALLGQLGTYLPLSVLGSSSSWRPATATFGSSRDLSSDRLALLAALLSCGLPCRLEAVFMME